MLQGVKSRHDASNSVRLIKALLVIVAGVASIALIYRLCCGPGKIIGTPLNAQSIVSIAILLACTLGSQFTHNTPDRSLPWFVPLLCCLLVFGVYVPSLNNPFLFDDYTHLEFARTQSWPAILSHTFLDHPQTGDYFFRPLGDLSFWFDYKWAGNNPLPWHLWNVALNFVNCTLVYILCRQLSLHRFVSLMAALIFALHPAHLEVVAWMAARYDLLAFFFTLATLIAMNYYLDTRRMSWFALMLAACLLATLSKESAFCLPLLAVCLTLFPTKRACKDIAKLSVVLAAPCAVVFAYRYWLIGSIGGYRSASGAATILNFNLLRTLKGLLFRQWGLLIFPMNWSQPPGIAVIAAWCAFLLVLLIFLLRTSRWDSRLVGCLALVLAASLPVQHLLLIGSDLAGARVLYLPTLGMALFAALLLRDWHDKTSLALAACWVVFEVTILAHNTQIWNSTAQLAQQTCLQAGGELRTAPGPISVRDLPSIRNGVYFLKNGFSQCVAVTSHQPSYAARVLQNQPAPREFTWDENLRKLIRLH